ncbi:MAG: hypothetical protein KJ666_09350 [Bacteroidetes bacterium]|nr:hypothetical protein [Bacteroidota bacterium]
MKTDEYLAVSEFIFGGRFTSLLVSEKLKLRVDLKGSRLLSFERMNNTKNRYQTSQQS